MSFKLNFFIILICISKFLYSESSLPTVMINSTSAEGISMAGISSIQYGKSEYMLQNPAVLSGMNKFDVNTTYIPWIFGTRYISGNVAYNMTKMVFGLGVVIFSSGEFENVLLDGTKDSKLLSMNEVLVDMGISSAIIGKQNFSLSVGGNIKYIDSNIVYYNAKSLGFDVGLCGKYSGINKNREFLFGAALQNIGFAPTYVSKKNKLPVKLIAGIGYRFNIIYEHILMVASEVDFFSKLKISIGCEYEYKNLIFVRAGYYINTPNKVLSNISLGAGIQWFNIKFDYALIFPDNIDMAARHVLSIGYKI